MSFRSALSTRPAGPGQGWIAKCRARAAAVVVDGGGPAHRNMQWLLAGLRDGSSAAEMSIREEQQPLAQAIAGAAATATALSIGDTALALEAWDESAALWLDASQRDASLRSPRARDGLVADAPGGILAPWLVRSVLPPEAERARFDSLETLGRLAATFGPAGAAASIPAAGSVTLPALVASPYKDRGGLLLWLSLGYGPGNGSLFADPLLMAMAELRPEVGDSAAEAWAAVSRTFASLGKLDVVWRLTLDPEGTMPREGPVEGRSLGAAFAAGLLAVVTGREGTTTQAVTGAVERGRIAPLGDAGAYKQKLHAAAKGGLSALVVAGDDLPQVEAIAKEEWVLPEILRLAAANDVDELARLVAAGDWSARRSPDRRTLVGVLPPDFQPREPFVGREPELAQLLSEAFPNSVVPVVGPPESGRSQLVAHAMDRVRQSDPSRPLTPVVLDLARFSQGSLPITRCIADRVQRWETITDLDADDTYPGTGSRIRERLVAELIDELGAGSSPLLVIDNVVTRQAGRADLDALLATDELFRPGLAILVSAADLDPPEETRRKWRRSVRLGPLDLDHTLGLLAHLTASIGGVASIADRLDPEVLYPGLIERGVTEFDRRPDLPRTVDRLAEAVFDQLGAPVERLLGAVGVGTAGEAGRPGGMDALMAASLLHHYPMTEHSLLRLGVDAPALRELRRSRFISEVDGGGGLRLSPLLRDSLRDEVERTLAGQRGAERANALAEAVSMVASAIGDEISGPDACRSAARAVEAALSWIEDQGFTERAAQQVRGLLIRQFAILSADELIFPFSAPESEQLAHDLGPPAESLDDRIAALVLAARSQRQEVFHRALDQAVEALEGAVSFNGVQLQAVDASALVGQLLRFDWPRILDARSRLIIRLRAAAFEEASPPTTLRRIFYWHLHTADLALSLDRIDEARTHREFAAKMIGGSTRPASDHVVADGTALARQCLLDARLSQSRQERLGHLQSARDHASKASQIGTEHAASQAFGLQLRVVRQMIDEVPTDEERKDLVEGVMAGLTLTFGSETQSWPLEVRTRVSSLVRRAAEANLVSANRIDAARQCIELLEPRAPVVAAASLGEPRPLLALARGYALLGRTLMERTGRDGKRQLLKALKLAEIASQSVVTADGWLLRLRLIDQLRRIDDGQFAVEQSKLAPELVAAIGEAKKWVKGREKDGYRGLGQADLRLWCQHREWRAQGNISTAAQYHKRMKWLVRIKKSYGPTVAVYLEMIRLESRYRGLEARKSTDRLTDLAPILELFDDARRDLGPAAVDRIDLHKGEFFRYVWRYDEAKTTLRPLVAGAVDTAVRASAAVALSRALVDSAVYSQGRGHGTDPVAHQNAIREAKRHLDETVGVRKVSHEVTVLRARISAELGAEWSALDGAFKAVFGSDRTDYLATTMKNLDAPRRPSESDAADLSSAVKHDFTDPALLAQFGQLWLRRAEQIEDRVLAPLLGVDQEDPLQALERAYGVFDTCRMLEHSRRSRQRSATSYLLGRSILAAAVLKQDPNPFEGASSHGEKTLLHFAQRQLKSAARRSVGAFYVESGRRLEEVHELKGLLGLE